MNNGWISLWRKLMDKGYYKKSEYVHLWVHLLFKANHEPSNFQWNQRNVVIKTGQFITGRKRLSEETGISENKCERILKVFENEQQIEQQKTNLFRLITILNYDDYQKVEQQIEQPVNNKSTTNRQQIDTNNNNNNNNNKMNECTKPKTDPVYVRTLFEKFWNEYPRKVAKEKAYESFKKVEVETEEELNLIVAALKAQIKAGMLKTEENCKYCVYASTWLNQKRYLDPVGVK